MNMICCICAACGSVTAQKACIENVTGNEKQHDEPSALLRVEAEKNAQRPDYRDDTA